MTWKETYALNIINFAFVQIDTTALLYIRNDEQIRALNCGSKILRKICCFDIFRLRARNKSYVSNVTVWATSRRI